MENSPEEYNKYLYEIDVRIEWLWYINIEISKVNVYQFDIK